ncbi:ABC transporter permease [Acidiphilium cryptum]|uniref:ABC-2 type transporter n=1 Tax=Acidiphilium cryptum (strain JF-5) TaxID=349163 RepID=A5FWH9_ACICJ|nr:ABC transporter permease [Acidiphilium cryptum]ABQ29961.1 ABC-2 type transporter [Acidiphilium cryptum JF-5]
MNDTTPAAPALSTFRKQSHFTLSADRGWGQRVRLASTDLVEGAKLWRLIWTLAFYDIKLRYRGSALGPFWLTISTGVQVAAMAFLYGVLFRTDIHTYLPYLAISMVLWTYLNTLISEGSTCFSQSDTLIKGTRMPFVVHAARNVVRNTIVLAHNLIVIVVVFAIMDVRQSLYSLLAIPALALWMIDAVAISLLMGALCARFRDLPQIILSVMQIAFFITPVIWYAKVLNSHPLGKLLIEFNPFYPILEILRAPLLGTPISLQIGLEAVFVSALLVLLAAVGFARMRGRVAYWV